MPVFFALLGIACAGIAAWLWADRLVPSDIQLGILATLVVGAFIFLALAYVMHMVNEIRDRLGR